MHGATIKIGRPVYLLISLILSPILEQGILAGYTGLDHIEVVMFLNTVFNSLFPLKLKNFSSG